MREIVTPALAALALLAAASCGKNAETEASDPGVDAAHSHATLPTEIIASGTFEGRSEHVTTGGVSIRKGDDGYYVIFDENFSLDGAPDPRLGFGNGEYIAETQFSELRKNSGAQSYKLPEGFDPAEYGQIYVWCEKFSVPLGVAVLAE